MKCLARLGDVKKMVEFAQLARDPSLFILAGNYLRSTNAWQEDPAILKAIVTFYRKARKLDLMTTFFIVAFNLLPTQIQPYSKAPNKRISFLKNPQNIAEYILLSGFFDSSIIPIFYVSKSPFSPFFVNHLLVVF